MHPYVKEQESTSTEIASIEARVRKELYPSHSRLMKAYPISDEVNSLRVERGNLSSCYSESDIQDSSKFAKKLRNKQQK